MSIRSLVNDFLDKTVDARFKREGEGRLVFFPLGFGAGRIVPDDGIEARLRQGCRRLMIGIFAIIIPVVALFNGLYQFKGLAYIGFFAACVAAGFASQLYPLWLSRGLPRSNERLSYAGAALQSLERFGKKFLVFGLVSSALLAAGPALMLIYPPARAVVDPVVMTICILVFAPMTAAYAIALQRRNRSVAS